MTARNLELAYDQGGQWTDAARERARSISGSPGEASPVKRRYRKRRQVIPAFSSDGDDR